MGVPVVLAAGKAPSVFKDTWRCERCIQVSKQYILSFRLGLFQTSACIFQQDNVKSHTAPITTARLRLSRRVWGWNNGQRLACLQSQPFHQPKSFITSWNENYGIRRPQTVEQLESYIRQEWHNIPLRNVQKLLSWVSRHLQIVVEKGNITWFHHRFLWYILIK